MPDRRQQTAIAERVAERHMAARVAERYVEAGGFSGWGKKGPPWAQSMGQVGAYLGTLDGGAPAYRAYYNRLHPAEIGLSLLEQGKYRKAMKQHMGPLYDDCRDYFKEALKVIKGAVIAEEKLQAQLAEIEVGVNKFTASKGDKLEKQINQKLKELGMW